MKFKYLKLQNFRTFKKLELELDPNLNVIVGVNGAGKTTILDACAIFMSHIISQIKTGKSQGVIKIDDLDIHNDFNDMQMVAVFETLEKIQQDALNNTGDIISQKRTGYGKNDKNLLIFIKDYAKILHVYKIPENKNIPIFAYYSVNRAINMTINNRKEENKADFLLDAYQDALEAGVNFNYFYHWYERQENLQNEKDNNKNEKEKLKQEISQLNKIKEDLEQELEKVINEQERKNIKEKIDEIEFILDTNNSIIEMIDSMISLEQEIFNESRGLKWILQALKEFMPEVSHIQVVRNENTIKALKNKEILDIRQFSEGEKLLFSLVTDLAQRLVIANPNTQTLESPLHGEGIVLIDEIELHLHPTWQREAIKNLTKVFPNIQFIITTHSPQVISEVRKNNLHLLSWDNEQKQPIATKASRSFGLDSNEVLDEIMESKIKNQDVNEILKLIYQAIDTDDENHSKKVIEDIEKRFNKLNQPILDDSQSFNKWDKIKLFIDMLEKYCDGKIPETIGARTHLTFWRD